MTETISRSEQQLACVYSALILYDDGLEANEENIKKVLDAANVNVDTYWPGLFANAIKKKGLPNLITDCMSILNKSLLKSIKIN